MNCYKELKELNSMKESNLSKMGKKIIEITHRRQKWLIGRRGNGEHRLGP